MSPPHLVHALLDALPDPAILVDAGKTVSANGLALDLLGRDIVGKDVRLAIRHPVALAAIHEGNRQAVELTGIGGLERSWNLSVHPLVGRLQLIRLSDQSALRAAEKMRVDFVANASHELRTPLATIVGYAETLAEDGELSADLRRRFGNAIHSEARRMLRIVEDLMSLSRIEADRHVAPEDRVSLEEAIRVAAENSRPLASARGCAVEVQVEPGLPHIRADRSQILQLLDNLVANAIRYGCPSSNGRVLIAARKHGGEAVLSVRDWGSGIDAPHIPRLTERFYRVDDARSRDSGGTGLGLAIVKHIVERHRGRLRIGSRPGEGTEVQVRLPLAGNDRLS